MTTSKSVLLPVPCDQDPVELERFVLTPAALPDTRIREITAHVDVCIVCRELTRLYQREQRIRDAFKGLG